jgi:1,4-alpha-glucan branching enzyme
VNVAFVLHSHLPWLRRAGTHPVGEEWLFQSWSEAYLPVLEMLERLAAAGGRDLLTLGITPVLAEQMDDPELLGKFHGWLGRRLLDLEYTISRYAAADRERHRPVWAHHWRRQAHLLEMVETRFLHGGLTRAFADLADAGVIQLLGGPSTHPNLALMDDPALIDGQIDEGLACHAAQFGVRPRGVWTPECAYRPAGSVPDPAGPAEASGQGSAGLARSTAQLPGLEQFWASAGVDHLVVDAPTLAGAVPTTRNDPGGHPPGGNAPDPRTALAEVGQADWVATAGAHVPVGDPLDVVDRPVLVGDSDVAAFGRNLAVSYQVWNPRGGYPADPAYRDFHKTDLEGGFKSWRITDRESLAKAPYDPLPARERAIAHADHFVSLLHAHLEPRDEDAVVVAAYDTELFGHWWYEGPIWLETVLRRLMASGQGASLRATTLAGYLNRHPPTRRLALPESSWGAGKGHWAWVTDETRWIWQALREAEARFAGLPEGTDPAARQAAWRELCLLQTSDWPFMINHAKSPDYAAERVQIHLARFEAACRGEELEAIGEHDGAYPPPPRADAAAVAAASGHHRRGGLARAL